MSALQWDLSIFGKVPQTGTIDLGTISEIDYYETPLVALGNEGTVTFTVIAGRLPPGLQVDRVGLLYGNPVVTDVNRDINDVTVDSANAVADNSRPYVFTIRAKDNYSVSDRTFSLTITNIRPPNILPRSNAGAVDLGVYEDGSEIDYQFIAYEDNPSADLVWEVVGGTLPTGLSLSADGKLSGYLYPNPPTNNSDKGRWDNARWDENLVDGLIPWDFVGLRAAAIFQFTISVYDGESYDQVTYIMSVYPKGNLTADSGLYTADLIHVLTNDSNRHIPILLNSSHFLPNARQLSYIAYKFNAIDFDGDQISFAFSTVGLTTFDGDADTILGFDMAPFDAGVQDWASSLTLDPDTGWLYGPLPEQTAEEIVYTFQVRVYKTGEPTFTSAEKSFSLRVLGNLIELVEWTSPSILGNLENQQISELRLETLVYEPVLTDYLIAANLGGNAVSPNVDTVTYHIESGELPVGLELQTNGLITGRVGYDYFRLDGGTTTIDLGPLQLSHTTWDSSYSFTANAVGWDASANLVVSTTKEFTITVNNINEVPFSDVYLKGHLSETQRSWFTTLLNNTSIFPPELIYRSIDPHFGKASGIKTLFNAGVSSTDMYEVALGMQTNHYKKKIQFGEIKTALALDKDFNPKYEVVYVELLDNFVNKQGMSVGSSKTLSGNGYLVHNKDQAINEPSTYAITEYKTMYPNSFKAMSDNVTNRIGFANKAAMPDWMTSVQPDGKIIGFTRALVLCYLTPDLTKAPKFNAEMVAFRLRNYFTENNISLNQIEFVADRYQIDLNLENYPEINDKYMSFPSLGVFT